MAQNPQEKNKKKIFCNYERSGKKFLENLSTQLEPFFV